MMKRFALFALLGVAAAMLFIAFPNPTEFVDIGIGVVPAAQLSVSAAIVVGVLAFDLLSHLFGRSSVLIEIGAVGFFAIIVLLRLFSPLPEVQRSGRGVSRLPGL